MFSHPISTLDATAFMRRIQHQATAMAASFDHFAGVAPDPCRSYLQTWSGTAENIADMAQAAEAALNP